MTILLNVVAWVVAYWKVLAVCAVAVVLIVGVGLVFRACNKPPKLDQPEIIKAQEAIEKKDREVMIEILTNSDVREQQIDENVAEGRRVTVNAVANSRQTWATKSNEELAAELERRAKE